MRTAQKLRLTSAEVVKLRPCGSQVQNILLTLEYFSKCFFSKWIFSKVVFFKMDFFKMDFFKNGFFQNGFFQSGFFSKWIFSKMDFCKMDFSKKLIFQKWFFQTAFFKKKIQILFFNLIFWGANVKNRSAARVLSCQEARKKGCAIFWQSFFLSWVCSAILAQLIYRFCGAIYRTGTAQRHEFDDHRGNDFDDHRSLNKFCTGTALL